MVNPLESCTCFSVPKIVENIIGDTQTILRPMKKKEVNESNDNLKTLTNTKVPFLLFISSHLLSVVAFKYWFCAVMRHPICSYIPRCYYLHK